MTPDELVIAVMDIRGDVAAAVPDAYLGGHATTSGPGARPVGGDRGRAGEAADPAGDPTRPEPMPRAGRAGPRIVVIADDYDIFASGGTEPLQPLLPYLPSARDLRLHVLLTRPVAGASRAMYDVALQTLRDTGGSC